MKKLILFTSPLLILLEVLIFNIIVYLLRQPHDTAVLFGSILICVSAYLNNLLFNFIKKVFKK